MWGPGCAGALAALPRARARHVERRCRRRAAVRPTLLAARRPQAHGAMQVLAVLLTGYTPASAAASSRVSMRVSAVGLLDCRASTFSLLLLYVVKLYDVSVHLDLCARAPHVSQCLVAAGHSAEQRPSYLLPDRHVRGTRTPVLFRTAIMLHAI